MASWLAVAGAARAARAAFEAAAGQKSAEVSADISAHGRARGRDLARDSRRSFAATTAEASTGKPAGKHASVANRDTDAAARDDHAAATDNDDDDHANAELAAASRLDASYQRKRRIWRADRNATEAGRMRVRGARAPTEKAELGGRSGERLRATDEPVQP